MNTSKKMLALFVLAVATAAPVSGFAQTTTEHHHTDSATTTAALTDGEVKKLDQDTGKITIKHSEIKHLDMPSMTMVFTAKDKKLLANIKPGDKIQFMAISEGGKMVVTDIQPMP